MPKIRYNQKIQRVLIDFVPSSIHRWPSCTYGNLRIQSNLAYPRNYDDEMICSEMEFLAYANRLLYLIKAIWAHAQDGDYAPAPYITPVMMIY